MEIMIKMKLGTVGVPNHGMEIKLAKMVRFSLERSSLKDISKMKRLPEKQLRRRGLYTGDVGVWEENFKIVDRKDIIITSGGKNVSPQEIENKIKISPFIKDAIVIGDKRKFLSALIAIEFDTVSGGL